MSILWITQSALFVDFDNDGDQDLALATTLGVIFMAMPIAIVGNYFTLSVQKREALKQAALAEKYQQLELLMLKMAEFDAGSNPQRSALLKQALSRSKARA